VESEDFQEPAGVEFKRGSVRWRCVWIAMVILWSAAALLVAQEYHRVQPGSPFLEIGKKVYYTHSSARATFLSHPAGRVAAIVIGLCLIAGLGDLIVRIRRHQSRLGGVALGGGILIGSYSIFGLLVGIVAVGPIGIFLILSSLPLKVAETPGDVGAHLSFRNASKIPAHTHRNPDVSCMGDECRNFA
jgi:hypothetical protein